jgi:hypothetical protein
MRKKESTTLWKYPLSFPARGAQKLTCVYGVLIICREQLAPSDQRAVRVMNRQCPLLLAAFALDVG